uniref:Uncharacterized protein n=1 Tax=Rhizophora mucronata TaxID=61149 RepID=A0A2P2PLG8_RHIMU
MNLPSFACFIMCVVVNFEIHTVRVHTLVPLFGFPSINIIFFQSKHLIT